MDTSLHYEPKVVPRSEPIAEVGGRGGERYRLVERIAVGGMAEIYLGSAGAEGFERPVVIKKIHPRYSEDARFVEMLINEAKITARLNHVGIVQILDLGVGEGDEHFIVMEFVEGKDLREIMDRADKRRTPLPLQLVLSILLEISEALDYAHRLTGDDGEALHLIHRDVSPSNILVSRDGVVKLTDFGVARFGRHSSQVGSLKGKLGYMAPEQARGEALDLRSDIFAVGAILYEILLGQRVFDGANDMAMLEAIRLGVFPRPRDLDPHLDPALEVLVLRAIAPDPDERFDSAEELASELRHYVFERFDSAVGSRELSTLLADLFEPGELSRLGARPQKSPQGGLGGSLEGFRSEGEPPPERRKGGFLEAVTRQERPSEQLLERCDRPPLGSGGGLEACRTSPELSTSDELALMRVISDLPPPYGSAPNVALSLGDAVAADPDEVPTHREGVGRRAPTPSTEVPALLQQAVAPDVDEAPTEQFQDEATVNVGEDYLASLPAPPLGVPRSPAATPARGYAVDEVAAAFEAAEALDEVGAASEAADPFDDDVLTHPRRPAGDAPQRFAPPTAASQPQRPSDDTEPQRAQPDDERPAEAPRRPEAQDEALSTGPQRPLARPATTSAPSPSPASPSPRASDREASASAKPPPTTPVGASQQQPEPQPEPVPRSRGRTFLLWLAFMLCGLGLGAGAMLLYRYLTR